MPIQLPDRISPIQLVQLLGKHDFQDEADGLGLIASLAFQGRSVIGYEHKLLLARSLTYGLVGEDDVRQKFREGYEGLKKSHEKLLHDAAADASRLLLAAPGLVTFDILKGGRLELKDEPMLGVVVEPAQETPYREAALTLTYGDNQILPTHYEFSINCHPAMLPAKIGAVLVEAEAEYLSSI